MSARALRVLVVDDERDTVLTLGILFRSEGAEVEMLREGEEVVAKVARFQPDVVLLDIGMPGRDGFEVAKELVTRFGKGGPMLVAVTAHASDEDRRMAREAGFDHHFAKPYDPQQLLELVTSLGPRALQHAG